MSGSTVRVRVHGPGGAPGEARLLLLWLADEPDLDDGVRVAPADEDMDLVGDILVVLEGSALAFHLLRSVYNHLRNRRGARERAVLEVDGVTITLLPDQEYTRDDLEEMARRIEDALRTSPADDPGDANAPDDADDPEDADGPDAPSGPSAG
jgi:hypothetical protein